MSTSLYLSCSFNHSLFNYRCYFKVDITDIRSSCSTSQTASYNIARTLYQRHSRAMWSRVIQSSFTDDYGRVHGYGIMYEEMQNTIYYPSAYNRNRTCFIIYISATFSSCLLRQSNNRFAETHVLILGISGSRISRNIPIS